MARDRASGKKLGARQALARRKAVDYVRRLGLRKAARRLETTPTELRHWLDVGFPPEKVSAATGLGRPGGNTTYVHGTNLAQLLKEKGARSLARLTGLPGRELQQIAKKNPRSPVKFNRDTLRKAIEEKGAQSLASIIKGKQEALKRANQIPLTASTRRLSKFISKYGAKQTAVYLGITTHRLSSWTKKGIPRSWEEDINQAIGKKIDHGPSEEILKRQPEKKNLLRNLKQVQTWNKKVPTRYRIRAEDVSRWTSLGTFSSKLEEAKKAYKLSKTPQRKSRRRKPPVKAPQRPEVPPEALPPRPPTPPPKKPAPPPVLPEPSVVAQQKKRNLLEARAEAFADGKYPKPTIQWGKITKWTLIGRTGFHAFKKIQKFVHELNLTLIGDQMIALARKIWTGVDGKRPIMTIRMTFAIVGEGNPFYPDAFIDGDDLHFITRNIEVRDSTEIEVEVRESMEEIFAVDSEVTLLYFEHYEVIKSVDRELA